MTVKRMIYLIVSCILMVILSACGNYTNDNLSESANTPTRHTPIRINRSSPRHTTRHARPVPARYRRKSTQPTRKVAPNLHINQSSVPAPPAPPPVIHDEAQSPVTRSAQQAPARNNANNINPAPISQEPKPSPISQKAVPALVSEPSSAETHKQNQINTAGKKELGSHKTEFSTKDKSRSNNIAQASNSINGHVVQPGETFSYNKTVGPTIERRGYQEGIIYVQGEKKKGFGGGVCQVSTTLSIAADNAGMKIVERHDHSKPVTYAKKGQEAATSYGGIDFKFKNENPHPIAIESSVNGGTISVRIVAV